MAESRDYLIYKDHCVELYHGKNEVILPLLLEERGPCAHLCFTDIPYNVSELAMSKDGVTKDRLPKGYTHKLRRSGLVEDMFADVEIEKGKRTNTQTINRYMGEWDKQFDPSLFLENIFPLIHAGGQLISFTSEMLLDAFIKSKFTHRALIFWKKCLAGNTVLYAKTQNGEAPQYLKDLVRLDPSTVKLWDGEKWNQVISWSHTSHDGNPLQIEFANGERVSCTSNHRWPTQRGLVEAKELRLGDEVLTCNLPEPLEPENPSLLDEKSIGWFVGFYLAEGSKSGSALQFSCHVDEMWAYSKIKEIAESFHGTARIHLSDGLGMMIIVESSILESVIEMYLSGNTSKGKHISQKSWRRSNVFLESLLMGYLDGDGHYEQQNNRWKIGFTNNFELSVSLRTLCARLGYSLHLRNANYRLNKKEYPGYRGTIRIPDENATGKRGTMRRNKSEGTIVAIERSFADVFWDIEVESDPHLISTCSGILTHNTNPTPALPRMYQRPVEIAVWQTKGSNWTFNGKGLTPPIYECASLAGNRKHNRKEPRVHPTQKPRELARKILAIHASPGQTVIDPFTGSGTFLRAAKDLGVNAIGIEQDERYARFAAAIMRQEVLPIDWSQWEDILLPDDEEETDDVVPEEVDPNV